ncbi:MAG: N-acyl amino acid synthase FeeM domain-containing protein [Gammaproteobacteria bacterium]
MNGDSLPKDLGPLHIVADVPQTPFDIARTYQEVLECWHLVYKCYIREGLIDTNPHLIHTAPQAFNPDTTVIFGRTSSRIYTTLTAIPDGPRGLPLDEVYPRLLDDLRSQNRRLIEVGLLADDRAEVGKAQDYSFDTMRLAVYCALHSQVDAVIGVHPHHADFYVRMMSFEVIGPIRSYPRVNNRPVVPLFWDRSCIQREKLPRLLRYIKEHPVEKSLFDQRFDFSKIDLSRSAIGRYLSDATKDEKSCGYIADAV